MDDINKFNKFDFEWLVINFGMAMGASLVLVPVCVGVSQLLVFLVSVMIAYPGIYLFQQLYLQTLFATEKPKEYRASIQELLGVNWGNFLAVIYFLMMLIWTVIYAEIITKILISYLYNWHVFVCNTINDHTIFIAVLMSSLIFIGFKSRKLLIRISSSLIFILVIAIIIASIAVMPFWNLTNLTSFPSTYSSFVTHTLVMLPFSLTSILFVQSLSPMALSYRKHYDNYPKQIVLAKTIKMMRLAFFLLVIVIGLYILSFSLVISHNSAIIGAKENKSVFLILSQDGQTNLAIRICGLVIGILSILVCFLSILGGMAESIKCLLRMLSKRISDTEKTHPIIINSLIPILIFFITWSAIVFEIPIFKLVPLSAPIFGILGCLVPTYAIYKVPVLMHYKSIKIYFIIGLGIALIISPILSNNLF